MNKNRVDKYKKLLKFPFFYLAKEEIQNLYIHIVLKFEFSPSLLFWLKILIDKS